MYDGNEDDLMVFTHSDMHNPIFCIDYFKNRYNLPAFADVFTGGYFIQNSETEIGITYYFPDKYISKDLLWEELVIGKKYDV